MLPDVSVGVGATFSVPLSPLSEVSGSVTAALCVPDSPFSEVSVLVTVAFCVPDSPLPDVSVDDRTCADGGVSGPGAGFSMGLTYAIDGPTLPTSLSLNWLCLDVSRSPRQSHWLLPADGAVFDGPVASTCWTVMISADTRTTTGSGFTRWITTGSADSRTTTGLEDTFLTAGSVATDELPVPVLDTRVSATGESAGAVTVTAAICGSGSSRGGSSCTVATVPFRRSSVVFVGAGLS